MWDWAQAELALSTGNPSLAVARAQQIAAATDEHAMVRPWLQDLLERAQRDP